MKKKPLKTKTRKKKVIAKKSRLVMGFISASAIFLIVSVIGYRQLPKKYAFFSTSSISPSSTVRLMIKIPTPTIPSVLKIPIIMYHYIEYVRDPEDTIRKSLDIPPHVFEGHLKTLAEHNYKTYFVRDIPDMLNGTIPYSTRNVVLSFDDGYEDFYTDAFPLLKKYQTKATVYIVRNFIGKKGFLTFDQISELINSGLIEIGSHTLDHVYLKNISHENAHMQILQSKLDLEQDFGIEVKTFAYPFGAFTPEVEQLVKEASYTAAVLVIPGAIQSKENLFQLHRIRAELFSINNIHTVLENYNK